MGVLMSKKQQVEKVQKCSSVIAAFKEGVKDRPAPSTSAQSEGSPEAGEKVEEVIPASSEKEKEKESEHKEEDATPGPSNEASVALREDCQKANQEAWSRLRDGKGVEPEDLVKAHQLTPPAFIRPKRDINDDQPLEVDLAQREQPANDEMCDVCEVWTADDLFPCRTCTRVFHDGCVCELGYLRAEALQTMREMAHTAAGWSCYYCDNVNLLLTEEEMYSLMETFKQCRIIPESYLVSDELLQYRHFVSKQLFDKDLTDEEEEEALAQFAALDPEKHGQIEWIDFLYHESLSVLRKFRTENSLVRLLTAKERDRARAVFQSLDQDKDGIIMDGEMLRAQASWFQKLSQDQESQSCNVSISHVGPISENSPASSSGERSRDDNRAVIWDAFLRESSIYILAARPNSGAMHIRLPQ
ncbi:PHD finger protein 24 isoform X2 [Alosa sapidissima]|uniref:PHD finger protein 24 isoform X2 n=1 Tax=Alosa sapidissima TaxID=34773 RepID=UPI001C08E68D|nr:PHD finger protein 24 isoform X2 [Alosa sapidissima]